MMGSVLRRQLHQSRGPHLAFHQSLIVGLTPQRNRLQTAARAGKIKRRSRMKSRMKSTRRSKSRSKIP